MAVIQLAVLQVPQDGGYAAVVSGRLVKSELDENGANVLFHSPCADHQLLGDGRMGASPCHQRRHLGFARTEGTDGIGCSATARSRASPSPTAALTTAPISSISRTSPFPQEHRIFRQHNSHAFGPTGRRPGRERDGGPQDGGAAFRALQLQRSVHAGEPVHQSGQPVPLAHVGAPRPLTCTSRLSTSDDAAMVTAASVAGNAGRRWPAPPKPQSRLRFRPPGPAVRPRQGCW